MPRFVIQKHRKRKSVHFDLMLESGSTLKTWSFTSPLKEYKSRFTVQPLKQLPDHRKAYLSYEGRVSRNRGTVKIWDRGVCRKIVWEDDFKAVVVKGRMIAGLLVILSLPLRPRLRLIPLIHFL
ncbi:MAG: DNA polymerase ligase N-terminal domain-containing protein [Planctomycetota bacterium]